MDSSFLIWPSFVLSLFSLLLLGRMIVQFGLPKHPLKFFAYSIMLSWSCLWIGASLVLVGVMNLELWERWKLIFLIWPALGLFMEIISQVLKVSPLQQKIMTRFPILGSLIALAFFPQWVPFIVGIFLLLVLAIFVTQVGKFRYHKRLFMKFLFFVVLSGLSIYLPEVIRPWFLVMLLLPSALYFYLLQDSFCVTAHLEQIASQETSL